MKHRVLTATLVVSLALNAALLAAWHGSNPGTARADVTGGEELAPYMATMQHQTHKLGLSLQARNRPLAAFYLEELHETVAMIEQKFPNYDNLPIAELAGAMLEPSFEPVDKALAGSNWPAATAAYDRLVSACNDCHAAANHEYIEITVPAGNPFNQTFAAK